MTDTSELDPVRYEMFLHRLWAIGEEGRSSIQKVTASPIVSQGGECMASFYTAEGVMILACSGHLRFAAATSDAIRKVIEWYGESPGFFDGDQLFFNDPYVAGAHTYDMLIMKPVFYRGALTHWIASSIHTADTGGSLRGVATEIYHEGIRIQGAKVVEKGEFREDVFRCLTQQCRDPEYVGQDVRSQIASNNVCARGFLELVDKFGMDFMEVAGKKVIEDSERMARARLRSLPDGVWTSVIPGTAWDRKGGGVKPYHVACRLEKKAEEMHLDFSGTSGQMNDTSNSTLAGTMAQLAVALTDFLFWDVPWSDGKFEPVSVTIPEGSILNCRFPAACGNAPAVGVTAKVALSDCIARMLYSGGYDDINAAWQGIWYSGGPLAFYGGHNREGLVTAQGLYDGHGAGLGATPLRDGVHCGGNMNIPGGGISDIERIEMQYPFIYFTRNHHVDGGGAGKNTGGAGSYRIYMVYGARDCSVNYPPYGCLPEGAGLFGGYPTGIGGVRAVFHTDGESLMQRLRRGEYPVRPGQLESEGWGALAHPAQLQGRVPLPEYCIVADFVGGGGGFGDPLERDPEKVRRDVRVGVASRRIAEEVFGVALTEAGAVNPEATARRRETILAERRAEGAPLAGASSTLPDAPQSAPAGAEALPTTDEAGGRNNAAGAEMLPTTDEAEVQGNAAGAEVLRFHPCLAIAREGDREVVRCTRCGHRYCRAGDNYKRHALRRKRDLEKLSGQKTPSGEPYIACFVEYYCPGCAALLQVDTFCPELGDEDKPVQDFGLSA